MNHELLCSNHCMYNEPQYIVYSKKLLSIAMSNNKLLGVHPSMLVSLPFYLLIKYLLKSDWYMVNKITHRAVFCNQSIYKKKIKKNLA